MTKRGNFVNNLKTLSFLDWIQVAGVIGGLAALIITCVTFIHNQKADTDRDVAALEERMDARTRSLEKVMDEIKVDIREIKAEITGIKAEITGIKSDLKKTSDLLHRDLAWRYFYQNDVTRKHLTPRYNIETRELEFVDVHGNVRNP